MARALCDSCGVEVSRYAVDSVCPTCFAARHTPPADLPAARLAPAVWMWSSPEASIALATRDLPTILRIYRRLNRLSQEKLANVLGYDKTYISMIETGRRTITDVSTRRHIARTLGLPAHALGVTDADDADFTAMLQFADSTIRLAEIARQSGRAVDAVNELWPLVARLEARAAAGHIERDSLALLARGRVALGVSLGTVLPEERLTAAARWTGKALLIAERLGDAAFLAHTLRMHGNELRKAGRVPAAVARLERAADLANDANGLGTALALLSRAAGALGDPERFDRAIGRYGDLLDQHPGGGMLFNPFTFREIELRGLMATGRTREAIRLVDPPQVDASPAAPQWHIIERVTAGHVLLEAGERSGAEEALTTALGAAEAHRLPHQIQRAVRAARAGQLDSVTTRGEATLTKLRDQLGAPALVAEGSGSHPVYPPLLEQDWLLRRLTDRNGVPPPMLAGWSRSRIKKDVLSTLCATCRHLP
ncbi:helix-turn-helix domain-containing protein [Saccharopolyspora cebuensis]|uniref:Helix-turn-helix domain-containing protein n=1 Tax=Saccharopolyspora cebuensis TaxID=418759 RepID=A0ABV4CI05_9PSEU